MTGYGQAAVKKDEGEISVEILSVNRKHLDLSVVLPPYLASLDPEIRKWGAARIFRGHVTIRVTPFFLKEHPFELKANLQLAGELYNGWKQIASHLGVATPSLEKLVPAFMREQELFLPAKSELPKQVKALVFEALDAAYAMFLQMRISEGESMKSDFNHRIDLIKKTLQTIKVLSAGAPERIKEKLHAKWQDLFESAEAIDERLLKEIALFAEKADISEEIVRFECHIHHFTQLFEGLGEGVGKKAEFILQELGREINTMGSKSTDIAIAQGVIDIKTELEKMREQVQNIE